MDDALTLLQLGAMLVSSPVLVLIAVALLLRRPMASARVTGALIVLSLSFAMVSIRDWYLVQDDDYDFSYVGFTVRIVKMTAVLYALFVLITEPDTDEVRTISQDDRDILQNETKDRQNLRDIQQDAREMRQRDVV